MRGWLRRNRWGLVALPIALVLLVAANSYRVDGYWWTLNQLVVKASGSQGHWVRYRETFSDSTGTHERRFTFRVRAVDRVASVPRQFGPPVRITHYDVYRVSLDFRADPSMVMTGCQLALTDARGQRYDYQHDIDDLDLDLYPCVDDDHAGPSAGVVGQTRETNQLGGDRPLAWTHDAYVFVAHGARVTGLRLWWSYPDYAKVSVAPGSA